MDEGYGRIWIAVISPPMPTVGAGSSQREDSPARPLPQRPYHASPTASPSMETLRFLQRRGTPRRYALREMELHD